MHHPFADLFDFPFQCSQRFLQALFTRGNGGPQRQHALLLKTDIHALYADGQFLFRYQVPVGAAAVAVAQDGRQQLQRDTIRMGQRHRPKREGRQRQRGIID